MIIKCSTETKFFRSWKRNEWYVAGGKRPGQELFIDVSSNVETRVDLTKMLHQNQQTFVDGDSTSNQLLISGLAYDLSSSSVT